MARLEFSGIADAWEMGLVDDFEVRFLWSWPGRGDGAELGFAADVGGQRVADGVLGVSVGGGGGGGWNSPSSGGGGSGGSGVVILRYSLPRANSVVFGNTTTFVVPTGINYCDWLVVGGGGGGRLGGRGSVRWWRVRWWW